LLAAIVICWFSESAAAEQIHGYQIPTTEGATMPSIGDPATPTVGVCKSVSTTPNRNRRGRRNANGGRRGFGASYCLPYNDSGPRKLGFSAPEKVQEAIKAVEMDLVTHFEHDSADLKELQETTSVAVIVEWLATTPDAGIKLTGHTDSTGTPEYNLMLSQRRTEAVKALFVDKGVPSDRIETEWFGETNLLMSVLGRLRENRRVEIDVFQITDEE